MSNKRYELNIADLLQIPEDRFDDFLVDLRKCHGACRASLKLLDTLAEKRGVTEKPSELSKMVWIDDGKHDGKIIFTSKADDPDTTAAGNDLPKYDPEADIKDTLKRKVEHNKQELERGK